MKKIVSIQDREQNLLEKKMELDNLNYEIAKNDLQRKIKKQTGTGAKIRDALEDIGTALDGFGDMGLDSTKITAEPKDIKQIDKLAKFRD